VFIFLVIKSVFYKSVNFDCLICRFIFLFFRVTRVLFAAVLCVCVCVCVYVCAVCVCVCMQSFSFEAAACGAEAGASGSIGGGGVEDMKADWKMQFHVIKVAALYCSQLAFATSLIFYFSFFLHSNSHSHSPTHWPPGPSLHPPARDGQPPGGVRAAQRAPVLPRPDGVRGPRPAQPAAAPGAAAAAARGGTRDRLGGAGHGLLPVAGGAQEVRRDSGHGDLSPRAAPRGVHAGAISQVKTGSRDVSCCLAPLSLLVCLLFPLFVINPASLSVSSYP
jgi:hypothetical protein